MQPFPCWRGKLLGCGPNLRTESLTSLWKLLVTTEGRESPPPPPFQSPLGFISREFQGLAQQSPRRVALCISHRQKCCSPQLPPLLPLPTPLLSTLLFAVWDPGNLLLSPGNIFFSTTNDLHKALEWDSLCAGDEMRKGRREGESRSSLSSMNSPNLMVYSF